MTRVPRVLRPTASWWILGMLLLPLVSGLLFTVGANPLPPSAIFTHVQPPNPTFCDQAPSMTCDQIVQYTEATGQLEFDLFLWAYFAGDRFNAVRVTATWPTSWGFVGASLCNGAHGSIDVQGNRAVVDASWLPDCPTLDTGVSLVARIVLDVTGYGEFNYNYTEPRRVTWGCPPSEHTEDLATLVEARAGVECDYCYADCGFQMLCHPQLTPATLDVEVPRGLSDQYTIQAIVYSWEDPCTPSFTGTESWMSLGVEQIDWATYLLTLTVDTQGMEMGEYSGWVIGEDDCRGCTRVNLTVTSSQGIEEPADPGPEPGVPKTWGGVKTLYR